MNITRLPWRATARNSSRLLRSPARPCRRAFSADEALAARPTLLTVNTTNEHLSQGHEGFMETLGKQWRSYGQEFTANAHSHDAAIILASPGFAKLLRDTTFLVDLVKLVAYPGESVQHNNKEFHIVAAVADRVHQTSPSSRVDEGISILRSRREVLVPKLWDPVVPKEKKDADAVGALTFELPDTGADAQNSITLPLSRTLFHNGKLSTLFAARFDISGHSPRLLHTEESHSHTINLPTKSDINYWAPLLPLTHARTITESFGNIVRGVEVDGQILPASTELEDAIHQLVKLELGEQSQPFSVFAVVTSESASSALDEHTPEPALGVEAAALTDDMVTGRIQEAANYFKQVLKLKGKMYRVLSGGGGWGKKKGLLSLDPQTSHFSLSEEEELENFFSTGTDSQFAPAGSKIQFFASCPLPPPGDNARDVAVFGVSGNCEQTFDDGQEFDGAVHGVFGASSDAGIYLHTRADSKLGIPDKKLKLSVPGSQFTFPAGV